MFKVNDLEFNGYKALLHFIEASYFFPSIRVRSFQFKKNIKSIYEKTEVTSGLDLASWYLANSENTANKRLVILACTKKFLFGQWAEKGFIHECMENTPDLLKAPTLKRLLTKQCSITNNSLAGFEHTTKNWLAEWVGSLEENIEAFREKFSYLVKLAYSRRCLSHQAFHKIATDIIYSQPQTVLRQEVIHQLKTVCRETINETKHYTCRDEIAKANTITAFNNHLDLIFPPFIFTLPPPMSRQSAPSHYDFAHFSDKSVANAASQDCSISLVPAVCRAYTMQKQATLIDSSLGVKYTSSASELTSYHQSELDSVQPSILFKR